MKMIKYEMFQVPPRWLGALAFIGALSYIFLVGKIERITIVDS